MITCRDIRKQIIAEFKTRAITGSPSNNLAYRGSRYLILFRVPDTFLDLSGNIDNMIAIHTHTVRDSVENELVNSE